MKSPLAPRIAARIERILDGTYQSGRQILFEPEVYEVLAALDLPTPAHLVVREAAEITSQALSRFGTRQVVMKIISPDLAHKQNAGGVRILYKDLEFIRYAHQRLMADMQARGIRVAGVLLAAKIGYSQEIGNETMLGFRESDTFGPVISFSKGGQDAEHFAECYSPPNLILAPIDQPWAKALLESTHIQKKYLMTGKTDYIDKIVDAGLKFSALAMAFSNFFPGRGSYVIHEFEINPFVFDQDGEFIALDGFARFGKRKAGPMEAPRQAKATLKAFFKPHGIVVAGISTTDTKKPGNIIFANLLGLGRQDVYGVNKNGGSLPLGNRQIQLHRLITDIDTPIDLAIVAVPAEASVELMRQCAAKGVKAVILIPGGFSETRKNQALEAELMDIARSHGIRIIGPNCLGIVYAGDTKDMGINTFFIPEAKFRLDLEGHSRVAILSQSGALGLTEIYNLRNAISPRVIVSYGNQLDVDPADLIAYLGDDPDIAVIGCYIEGFKPGAGRRFFDVARQSQKPIVVYKAGRTKEGRKATESHTASIAGEYRVARAAMKQAGLIVTDTMIEHGDLIKTFALLHDVEAKGQRVAIIANAGYEKTSAADSIGGLEITRFDARTRQALEQLLPSFVSVDPLLDLTPMADDAMFAKCVDIVLQSDAVDALFVSIVPMSADIHTTDEEILADTNNIASQLVEIVRRHKKPTVVSVNVVSGADALYNQLGKVLDSGGIPTFLTADRAMACLNAFIRYRLTQNTTNFSAWLQ